MAAGGCEISFTGDYGDTYSIPCDQVQYVTDTLGNNGNSNITLYPRLLTSESYPYIVIRPGHYAQYYDGSYQSHYIMNASVSGFNILGQYYRDKQYIDICVTMIITFYCLVRLFKK